MAGSAIVRKLNEEGFSNIVTRTSSELDLRNQQSVNDFFENEKPAYVFVAAAKVGGIMANNTYRGEFLYDNLMIEANIIHASYKNNVKKLLVSWVFMYLSKTGSAAFERGIFVKRAIRN